MAQTANNTSFKRRHIIPLLKHLPGVFTRFAA
jgi:hypothetical protein